MPLFSVVIPLYNKQDYIAACIQSVMNQSFQDFEIIVVNDSSTDNSLQVFESFNIPELTIINHVQNKGLSASRNTGIQNSQSQYIAFLDADDCWTPVFLETVFNLINNYPQASIFGTDYVEVYPNGKRLAVKKNLKNFTENDGLITDFFISGLQQPIYCPSSFCVKKTVFDAIGLYNETITFGEDIDFNIRANLNFQLAYSKTIGCEYTMYSQNQITQTSLKGKKITHFSFYEKQFLNHKSLKLYLDFQRYVMAKNYKLEQDLENFNQLKKEINFRNLTLKQQVLLLAPIWLTTNLKRLKLYLLEKGIKVTSYN